MTEQEVIDTFFPDDNTKTITDVISLLKQAQIERVEVGAKSYNVHSTDKEVNFLTKTYYVFNLKETE